MIVVADITHQSIRHGEIGLFDEVWKILKAKDGDPLQIELISRPPSVAAIKKKLLGKPLDEKGIYSIIKDIVDRQLTPIETTYFVASGYVKPYSLQELIWLVKAMAMTGETFTWGKRKVVDKHSVGGLAGNRTTMVVIPIIASLGLLIPKTSSRAITSPSGTADTMEVLAPVSFTGPQVKRIVSATGGCLIWGGGLSIAPADDLIIRVSRPLSLEPYDKMIVSIMAKKVAMGVTCLIIDMPYGPDTKIASLAVAQELAKKFRGVAKAFGITIKVKFDQASEPVGKGIGPALEARDVLRVLQQKEKRPRDLEAKAIGLAAELLELSKSCKPGAGKKIAEQELTSGRAWKKMQQIIRAQGGNPKVDANQLMRSAKTYRFVAKKSGKIIGINNRAVDEVARTLGAPDHALAGIYLHHKIGYHIKKGEKLLTLYSYSQDRLNLAIKAVALPYLIHLQ
jgi:putative thymidine phosphorylase